MGYRGYEHRAVEPRFAFGHGLSYSTFEIGTPQHSLRYELGTSLSIRVAVTNVGDRTGSEVLQCYVGPEKSHLIRPTKELKAFSKVSLEPGETSIVEIVLDDRSFAYWDPGQEDWEYVSQRIHAQRAFVSAGRDSQPLARGWRIDPGLFRVYLGRSCVNILAVTSIEVVGESSTEDIECD
jgi:beta-glucosidase